MDIWSIAGSIRLGGEARAAPYVKLERNGGNETLMSFICIDAPNGSCARGFASNAGIAASLGFRHALSGRLLVGTGIGAGAYRDTRTFVDLDASFRILTHVGAVANLRYMRWSSSGHPHWFAPLTFGVRVH